MKIYGPYTRKDGRKHVVLVREDGTKTTKSYPRLLMEDFLGRELLPEETVDHINHDKTDDRLENLQILTLSDNVKKEMCRTHREAKSFSFVCPCCGHPATKPLNFVKRNRQQGKEGPFCSRKCAGKFTHKNHWYPSP